MFYFDTPLLSPAERFLSTVSMETLQGGHVPSGVPIQTENFDPEHGLKNIERLRSTLEYRNSWQSKWKVLWLRPKRRSWLNIPKLAQAEFQKIGLDGEYEAQRDLTSIPQICQYERKFDPKGESFVMKIQQQRESENGLSTFGNVGHFMDYTQSASRTEEIGGELPKNINGIKKLTFVRLHTDFKPLHISNFPSSEEFNDPLLHFSNPLQLIKDANNCSSLQISPLGIISSIHFEDHGLPKINICHVGYNGWLIIDPKCVGNFLKNVEKCISENQSSKSSIYCVIREKLYSVTLEQLDFWGIKYTLIFQEEGDIMITFPGVLHGMYTIRFSISSSMNFLTLLPEDAKHIKNNYKECRCNMENSGPRSHGIWIPKIPLIIEQSIWEWILKNIILVEGDTKEVPKVVPSSSKQAPVTTAQMIPIPLFYFPVQSNPTSIPQNEYDPNFFHQNQPPLPLQEINMICHNQNHFSLDHSNNLAGSHAQNLSLEGFRPYLPNPLYNHANNQLQDHQFQVHVGDQQATHQMQNITNQPTMR